MISCFEFLTDFTCETGAVLLDSPGRDVLFAVMCDDGGEVFSGGVDAGEVVYVEIRQCVFNVVCEGVPVCPLVVGVCAFGRGGVGSV